VAQAKRCERRRKVELVKPSVTSVQEYAARKLPTAGQWEHPAEGQEGLRIWCRRAILRLPAKLAWTPLALETRAVSVLGCSPESQAWNPANSEQRFAVFSPVVAW